MDNLILIIMCNKINMKNKLIEKQEKFSETTDLINGLYDWLELEYSQEYDFNGECYSEVIINTLNPALKKIDLISDMIDNKADMMPYIELHFLYNRRQQIANSVINELGRL